MIEIFIFLYKHLSKSKNNVKNEKKFLKLKNHP